MLFFCVSRCSSVVSLRLQIVTMSCDLKQVEGGKSEVFLKLNFEDKMQRELCSELKEGTTYYCTVLITALCCSGCIIMYVVEIM